MNMSMENPYVGPRTFLESDSDRFFGRDREARDLLALVVSEPLVLFYAQSGAGKSSLVNTRLIPELRKRGFRIFTGRVSGDAPAGVDVENIFVFNLLQSLTQKGTDPAALAQVCLKDFIASLFQDNPSQSSQPHVLIIDQFEEIFRTHHEAWEKRADFFSQLAEAMEVNPYLWVVLIMREDFIASLDPYIHLLPGRLRMRYYMQRLERAAALEAIKKPVRNLRPFDEGIAEKLVDDLRGVKVYKPDGTPEIQPGQYVEPVQLQVVCANLWGNLKLKPPSDTITGQDLSDVGDVDTSLGNYYADRVKAVAESQNVHERKIREWFGRELISSGGVRTPVLREQNGTSGGLEDRVVQALHDLVRAEQRGGAIFYELTHDRLVEPILANNKKWEEDHFSPLHRQASLWDTQGQDEKWLLSDQALIEVELWARENPNDVTDTEEAFLRASRKYQAKLDAERETQRRELEMSQKLADEQARSALRARRSNAVYIVMGVIAVITAIYAFFEQRQAQEAENKAVELAATAQRLAAEARSSELTTVALDRVDNQLDLAILLGLGANSIPNSDNTQTRRALLTILQKAGAFVKSLTFENSIGSFKFRSDGKSFILQDEVGITVWDLNGRRIAGPIPEDADSLYSIVLNPQGSSFATLDEEGVILWDLEETKLGGPFLGAPAPLFSTAFNPDGSILAASGKDGSLFLWDFPSGEQLVEPLSNHTDWVNHISFSPDGSLLATASDDTTFILWDLANREDLGRVLSQSEPDPNFNCIASTAFSVDGTTLATGYCSTGTIAIWDVSKDNVRELNPLQLHEDGVYTLKFNPVESILASGGKDGVIALWDLSDPDNSTLLGQTGDPFVAPYSIYSLDISPDGQVLVSGHSDGGLLFWDISDPASPVQIGDVLYVHTGTVNSIKFSPDGETLASGSFDGSVLLWDVASRQPVSRLLSSSFSPVNSVSYHPDGTILAASTESGYIRLWNVSDPVSPTRLESTMEGKGTLPDRMEYSRDSNFITFFSTIRSEFSTEEASVVLDVVNHQPLGPGQIMFEDPEGRYLVLQIRDSAEGDQIRLVDFSKKQPVDQSIPGTFLALAPNSDILAYKVLGENAQSIIQLWDLSAGKPIKGTVEGEFLALSPDGSTVVYRSVDEEGVPVIIFQDFVDAATLKTIPASDLSGNPVVSADGSILAFKTIDYSDNATILNLFFTDTGAQVRSSIKTSENREIYRLSSNGKILFYTSYDTNGNQTVGALNTSTGDNIGTASSGNINQFLEFDTLIIYETYDYLTGNTILHLHDPFGSSQTERLDGSYLDIFEDLGILLYNNSNGVNFYDIKNRKPVREPVNGTFLDITQDGKTLATLSDDHTITFWNLEKTWPVGEPLGENSNQLSTAVLSPNGKMLAWVGPDGLTLQDAQSGSILNESVADHFSSQIPGEDTIFSPDGRTVAITNSLTNTTTFWNLAMKQQIGQEYPGIYLTYSPDGRWLALPDYNANKTIVLDLSIGQPLTIMLDGVYYSFSPDGRKLAVGNGQTSTTALLDLETQQVTLDIPGEPVAFLPPGTTLVLSHAATYSTILWDTVNNRQIKVDLPGFTQVFSSNGKHLAVADSLTNTTTIVDTSQPQKSRELRGSNPLFSPDGTIFSIGDPISNTTTLWDPGTQQQVGRQLSGSTSLFSSDGRTLAVVDYSAPSVTFWDLRTYEQAGEQLPGDSFVFSPDGSILAIADYDSTTITLWNMNTQKPVAEAIPGSLPTFSADGSTAAIYDYNTALATIWDSNNGQTTEIEIPSDSFVLSAAGELLAVVDYSVPTVSVWDLRENRLIVEMNGDRPHFSPDGKFLTIGRYATTTVSVLDTDTFEAALLRSIHPTELVFSPDSTHLASYAESAITVRDLDSGEVTRLDTTDIYNAIIPIMGFSADGTTVVALGEFGLLYTWDVKTGDLLIETGVDQPILEGFTGVAKFSPQGNYMLYESEEKLHIWDIKEQKPLPGTLPSLGPFSFSPDGSYLAALADDRTIILYNFPELEVHGLPLDTGLRGISNLGLVMEDTSVKYLITQDDSGNTQIWDWAKQTEIGIPMPGNLQYAGSSTTDKAVFYIDTSGRLIKFDWDLTHQDWVEMLCPLAGRNFSQEEWNTYFPDEAWPPANDKLTCPGYPLGS